MLSQFNYNKTLYNQDPACDPLGEGSG